jgi:amino acid adenylation domain-containing protein
MMDVKKRHGAGDISAVKRELLASLLADEGVELSQTIPRRKTSGPAPLSFSQQRLWFVHQMEPDSPAYHLSTAVRLKGRLNLQALGEGLDEIVRRHGTLRTVFAQVGDEPVQVVKPAAPMPIPVTSLEDLPEQERGLEVKRLVRAEAITPFDLATGPLLRVSLLRLGEQDHVLLFTFHHIISDGWSSGVLVRELIQLYGAYDSGHESPLAELPIQYADFAAWQRERLKGAAFDEQMAYWEERLAGSEPLALPTDHPRPHTPSHRGGNEPVAISRATTEALRRLSKREGCTLFMTVMAAFNALLQRHAGQDDISVGTPVAGRGQVETEGLIGFFVNTLVLRTDLSGDPAFRALLGRVRGAALGAYANQDVPFETLVERLQPERVAGRTPLFQVALTLQAASAPASEIAGLQLSPVGDNLGTAKFDLTLDLRESPEGLVGVIEYSTDLFEEATIGRMGRQLETLLDGVAADPDRRISALPLMTEAEGLALAAEWNAGVRDSANEGCLHHLFERRAALSPDSTALLHAGLPLSYRDLNLRSNRLAHRLIREGVGPDSLVGLLMDRSPEFVVALLGILKAGGAYVPLDPSYPEQRLSFMMEDSGLSLLLAQERHAASLPLAEGRAGAEPRHGVKTILLDADSSEFDSEPADNPSVPLSPDHLAYVSYTSGSTGTPKGTAVPHRSVTGFMLGVTYADFSPSTRLLQHSSLSWDALTLELWPALCLGGSCVLYDGWLPTPADLARAVSAHGVNTLWLTSSLFNSVIDSAPEALSGLSQVLTGGEALSEPHVRRALELLPGARLVNGYGPSECVVFACCQPLSPGLLAEGRGVPIGRPVGDRRVYLLDPYMRPVPPGVAGELYVGGPGVSRGYLGRPALTAERFVPDPFSAEPGARLYKTGDLARSAPGGPMEFAGRADDQVKVRGFRVEPGEVEAALASHPSVRECAVLVRGSGADRRLVAYAVARPGADADAASLRAHLRGLMPDYMIPSGFLLLPEMPLTPHGKLDRRALLALAPPDRAAAADYVAPRTPVEEVVAGLWAEVLKAGPVGVRDNFFEAGGHSLLAAQVVSRLRKVFGVELPLRRIFEGPTVESVARAVEEEMGRGPAHGAPPLTRVARDGELPLSFSQQRLWFLDRLHPGTTAYNLPAAVRVSGPLDVAVLGRALSEVVRRHEVLRTVFAQVDGRPSQVVRGAEAVDLPLADLSGAGEEEREAMVLRAAAEEARLPFDLSAGPLVRARVLKLKEEEHVLVLCQHHIVSDGWSTGVLVGELTALYGAYSRGEESPLEELPLQYADYAAWQREWLRGEVLEAGMAYWRGRLGGELPVLDLPADRPRPSSYAYEGGRVHAEVPAALAESLRALGRAGGATLFMTLLAGFKALLSRYSGQEDVLVGTPVAGRGRAEVEPLIGFFVNTLVLRTDLSGDPSFAGLLGRVRETALGAYAHQEIPFEKLVEELGPGRDAGHSPLFQAMFVLQSNAPARAELPGLTLSPLAVESDFSQFDLTLVAEEGAGGEVSADFCYNAALFDAATVRRMASAFVTLLGAAAADPGAGLSRLPLTGEGERARLLTEWGRGEEAEVEALCAHELFEAQAARRPGAVAVACGGEEVSYRELNERANRLAHYLRRRGVGPEARVGVSVGRSAGMVAAVLGVMKAGGAYVPLDASYPEGRLAYMLEDSGVWAVVADAESAALLPAGSAEVLVLDELREELANESCENPEGGAVPDNLAYVIYTSGSTGRPKGTLVSHRGVANLARAQAGAFGVGAYSRVLQFASPNFDASVSEIFVTLGAGATLCVAGRDELMPGAPLRATLAGMGVTAVTLPPAALGVMSAEGLEELETVVTAGEACPPQVAARWSRGRRFVNAYGPTEVTVCATMGEWGAAGPEGAGPEGAAPGALCR